MIENLDKLWQELEASRTSGSTGWVRRLANPGSKIQVHAAVKCNEPALSIMLDIPLAVTGGLRGLPTTAGLSVTLQAISGIDVDHRALIVELEDREFVDLFSVFCTDLVERLSRCGRIPDAMTLLLERLGRWQHFMSIARDGLSYSSVVGLFGELHVLRSLLVPIGGIAMVAAWTGAQREPQDFVVPGVCALEVKTTESRGFRHVHINGERQLDQSALSHLFLTCIRLQADNQSGENLRTQVDELRALAAGTTEFKLLLERRLLGAGYMDRHAKRYDQFRFRIDEQRFFLVEDGFPRLVPKDLSAGVDAVSYRLDLRNCAPFERNLTEVKSVLGSLQLVPLQST
jgi:hypothetical protein